jgi:hypothetical protein
MAERISIPCPNCGRILLIPHQNLGRGGRCRHCGHLFRAPVQGDSDQELTLSSYYCPPLEAGMPGVPGPMLSSTTMTVLAPADEDEPRTAPQRRLFRGLAGACRRLAGRVGERAGKLRELDPMRWLVLLRSRVPRLPGRGDPGSAPGHATPEWELDPDREAARATVDEWRSVLSAIREQAAEANRLKEGLRDDLAGVERIRVQLKEAYPLVIDPNSQAALEKIQELEALRAECEGLREEAGVLRSQLGIRVTEARERCNHLTEERDAAYTERDRWKAGHGALERELEQTRDLLGAERDALGREVDQLQVRLAELERSRDEAGRQHERERASWEDRRREQEGASEHQRRDLLEAEHRLSQQQAGFEAERQGWRRQLDEQSRRVESLQRDLTISEQLRAAVESERDEARAARSEAERNHQVERDRLVAALEQAREVSEAAAMALRPRPQARSYRDPEAFRSHLERWLAEARAKLVATRALSQWLEYETTTAGEEISLLDRAPAPAPRDPAEEPAAPFTPAP